MTATKFQKDSKNSFWRYPIYLNKKIDRLTLQSRLAKKYKIRITWMYEPLCHLQPLYRRKKKTVLPVAENTIQRLINLPTHLNVSEKDAKKICNLIILECSLLYND